MPGTSARALVRRPAHVTAGHPTRLRRVPLTVVLVVVGLPASAADVVPGVGRLEGEAFEEVVVFTLLPVLVFAAALGFDLRAFARDLGAILALAVVAALRGADVGTSSTEASMSTGAPDVP